MTLYENIKLYRKKNKMTQDELARRTGYNDRSSIAKIEKGLVDLPLNRIKQFADVLGVSASDLMGWREDEEHEKPTEQYDGLSEYQKEIIEFAKSVPEDKAAMVLRVMKSILEDSE